MKKGLTDIHIHAVSFGFSSLPEEKKNRTKRNAQYKFMEKGLLAYHKLKLNNSIDQTYLDYLSNSLKKSNLISRGVIFGLDGLYDQNGAFDEQKTTFMIDNDYVYQSVKPCSNLHYAASVNPARKDALDELERVKEQKAVLIKLLPNVQHIDLADQRYIPYFRKLAKLKIPLLGHNGREYAIAGSKQKFGHLEKYRLALEEGVKVIAAHGCASGLPFYQNQVETMLEFYEKFPNFFMDLSALSLLTRFGMIEVLQKYPELKSRMFYGSDFPLPVTPQVALMRLSRSGVAQINKVKNYFDRYGAFLKKFDLLPEKDPFNLFPPEKKTTQKSKRAS